MIIHLEQAVEETLPRRLRRHLSALGVDKIPVELTATGVDVHLGSAEPSLALPEVTSNPESSDDESSEVGGEEVGGGTNLLAILKTNGGYGSVELMRVSMCGSSWK